MGEVDGAGGDLAATRAADAATEAEEEEEEEEEEGDDGGRGDRPDRGSTTGRGGRDVDASGDDGARPSIMSLRFCRNVRNRANGDGMPGSRGVALAM